jgi:hypothetical protein
MERATDLAYALQYTDGMFEISYMKDGHGKLDVCIVPNALYGGQSTGLTKRVFLCCSLYKCINSISLAYKTRRTSLLSRTPFFTGRRSAAVYKSR